MNLYMFKNESDNKKNIIRTIFESEALSRSRLAEAVGLSSATVSKQVFELIEAGIIEEYGEMESTGGRKPILLRIKPEFAYIVSVDIGSYSTKIGIVNINGAIVEKHTVQTPGFLVENLTQFIDELISRYDINKIIGIGVCISGMVNYQEGKIIFCPNIESWNHLDLVEILEKKYGLPCFLDTSSRGMALAEYWFGAGKHVKDQIFVSIGNGIGAGIILDSHIFRGNSGFSGELGHIQVDERGGRCSCGNYGCLENYVTVMMIQLRVARRIRDNDTYTPLKYMINVQKLMDALNAADHKTVYDMLNVDILTEALNAGDKIVYEILMDSCKMIGVALTNIANVMNPELIVLGGGLIERFPIVVDEIARIVKARSLVTVRQHLDIKKSTLGNDGPIIGSALLVINKFLE